MGGMGYIGGLGGGGLPEITPFLVRGNAYVKQLGANVKR